MNKVILIGFCIVLFSCSRGFDNIPDPPIVIEKYPIVYAYSGEKNVKDFVLYTGPNGEKQNTDNFDPKEIWKDRLEIVPDSIILNSDSTLLLNFDFSIRDYCYKDQNDSIYIKRNNNTWSFLGTKSDNGFVYNEGFYFTTTPHGYLGFFGQIGSDYGLQSYKTRFFETAVLPNPEALTDKRDTVAWCNSSYRYNLMKKE